MFFTTFKFAIEQQDPIWDSLSLTKQDDDYLLEIESFHTPSAEKSLNVSNDEVASFFAEIEKLGVLSWYHRWDNSIYGENQWSLTIDDEEYYGSNWYPEDFDKVVELLVAHFGFPEQKLHPAVSFPGSIELAHLSAYRFAFSDKAAQIISEYGFTPIEAPQDDFDFDESSLYLGKVMSEVEPALRCAKKDILKFAENKSWCKNYQAILDAYCLNVAPEKSVSDYQIETASLYPVVALLVALASEEAQPFTSLIESTKTVLYFVLLDRLNDLLFGEGPEVFLEEC